MRLRLQAEGPLPAVKAWVLSGASPGATIDDLKHSICHTVQAFKSAKITPQQFTLEMEGFELLSELPVDGILKEGDLIVAMFAEIATLSGKKRKARHDGMSFEVPFNRI